MHFPRPIVLAAALAVALAPAVLGACGGSISVLHARGRPSGDGPGTVEVKNSSGVTVQRLFIAKTEDVNRARAGGVQPDSAEDQELFGDDRLDNAGLIDGHSFPGVTLPAGRYDFLVVDPDQREQLIKGLKISAGGKYVLEVGSDWTQARR
jgi:hypothetical protein